MDGHRGVTLHTISDVCLLRLRVPGRFNSWRWRHSALWARVGDASEWRYLKSLVKYFQGITLLDSFLFLPVFQDFFLVRSHVLQSIDSTSNVMGPGCRETRDVTPNPGWPTSLASQTGTSPSGVVNIDRKHSWYPIVNIHPESGRRGEWKPCDAALFVSPQRSSHTRSWQFRVYRLFVSWYKRYVTKALQDLRLYTMEDAVPHAWVKSVMTVCVCVCVGVLSSACGESFIVVGPTSERT